MKSHLLLIAAAILGSTNANAACVLGMGDTCPLSESEAARLIKANMKYDGVEGISYAGSFQIRNFPYTEGSVGGFGTNTNPQAQRNVQDVASIFNKPNSTCNEMPAVDRWREPCQQYMLLRNRGLITNFKALSMPGAVRAIMDFKVGYDKTPKGEPIFKLQAPHSGESPYPEFITYYTHQVRFKRIVYVNSMTYMGSYVAEARFEYDAVPITWAHIEKLLPNDSLPTQTQTSNTLRFMKTSNGWVMVQ